MSQAAGSNQHMNTTPDVLLFRNFPRIALPGRRARRAVRWAIALGPALLLGAVQAADWPQWRGPNRDGTSTETGLLKKWPEGGPKLLWHTKDLGAGYSTPAVVGERLYLINNQGLENELIQACAVADGKKVWSTTLGKVGNPNQSPSYPGARSTPTVDGSVVYALSSDGVLAALDASTGKIRWQKDVRSEFGGQPGKWAYAESPLVDGETLVCTPGGAEAAMVALNKKDGSVIWKSAVPGGDRAAYASVMIAEAGGIKQYVQFLEKGIVGIDARTGKFLWRYDKTAQNSPANIPTPVVADGMIYSATGRGGGGLLKLKGSGEKIEPEEVYFSPKSVPTSIGGAVKVGNYLYGTTDKGLLCLEFATGTVKWEKPALGAASLCYADGRLYLHGENGEVGLVAADPAGYQELGRFTPPDLPERKQGKAWAYPVVANGRLYLHDLGHVWAYDVKQ